jgi:hypothetical protein
MKKKGGNQRGRGRRLPFDDDYDYDYSIDERHGNKSEISGSRSRSKRYRSKSEDVNEKRKNDIQSEELRIITKGVKAKKKKRIRVKLGSLTRIEPKTMKITTVKKNLQIETQDIENEYQEMLF